MTPSAEPAAAPINPLSAAFDAALGGGTSDPTPSSDFIESTLAMLDAPEPGTNAEPVTPEPGTNAEPVAPEPGTSAEPADPLAAIDDQYPDSEVDGLGEAAKARWGEVKAELKAERRAAYALKKELEELKQKSLYDPQEVETLKKQVEEYNKELAVHRIEATQEYKQAIEEPLRMIGEAAASVARRYEVDQDALFDALAMTDEATQQKMLTDIVDGMSDRDRLKIYQMADDTLMLLRKRDDMKARSHEAMQELDIRQKQAQEREQAERKRTYSTHMDRLFESLEDKLPFHPLDPNESKTAVLEKLKQDAMTTDVAAAGPDVQAYSAAAGVVLPRLIKQFRALAAENNTLKSRLNGASAASPTKARALSPVAQPPASTSTDVLENIFSQLPR